METIYDCMIQLTLGLEYAHNNGLVHGTFGLQNVALSMDGDTPIYKLTNFTPGSSLKLPMTTEANFWPFIKGRKKISKSEKQEILMLKDIYSLGICLLELMIGRYSTKKFSISLDSLPLTWAEYQESTPLIQVLVECIQLDAIAQRRGKLAAIRTLLIREHARFFDKKYYKLGQPYVGKESDILNKMAIAALFQDKIQEAEQLWEQALDRYPTHFDTKVNFELYRWKHALTSDEELLNELEVQFSNKFKGRPLEGIVLIALGEKEKGLDILKKFNELTKYYTSNDSENLRRRRAREHAREVYHEANLLRHEFF